MTDQSTTYAGSHADADSACASYTSCLQPLQPSRRALMPFAAIIAEYLASSGHASTLSVFGAETGLDAAPRLTAADVLRFAGLDPASSLYASLVTPSGAACLAERILDALAATSIAASCRRDTGCDARNEPSGLPTPPRTADPRATASERLRSIEEEFQLRAAALVGRHTTVRETARIAAGPSADPAVAAAGTSSSSLNHADFDARVAAFRATELHPAPERRQPQLLALPSHQSEPHWIETMHIARTYSVRLRRPQKHDESRLRNCCVMNQAALQLRLGIAQGEEGMWRQGSGTWTIGRLSSHAVRRS